MGTGSVSEMAIQQQQVYTSHSATTSADVPLEPNQLVFVATRTENERKTEQKRIEVATKFHSNSHTPGQQAQEITILLLVKIQPIFLTQLYEVISIPNSNLKFA